MCFQLEELEELRAELPRLNTGTHNAIPHTPKPSSHSLATPRPPELSEYKAADAQHRDRARATNRRLAELTRDYADVRGKLEVLLAAQRRQSQAEREKKQAVVVIQQRARAFLAQRIVRRMLQRKRDNKAKEELEARQAAKQAEIERRYAIENARKRRERARKKEAAKRIQRLYRARSRRRLEDMQGDEREAELRRREEAAARAQAAREAADVRHTRGTRKTTSHD